MDVNLVRTSGGPPMKAVFSSDKVQASAIVDSDKGTITEIDIVADVHTELMQALTENQIQGNALVTVHFDQLVPYGYSYNGDLECIGNVEILGKLRHVPSDTIIRNMLADFTAELSSRQISVKGSATLNDVESSFHASLSSRNKNKLNSVGDLYTTIANQLPRGTGVVSVESIPSSVLRSFIPEEQQQLLLYVGPVFSSTATFNSDGFRIEIASNMSQFFGTVQLRDNEIDSIIDAKLQMNLSKSLTTELFGVPINAESKLLSNITSIDIDGNAEFDVSFDIGKQHTFIQGTTTRQADGKLDAFIAATGIDTRLLDAIWEVRWFARGYIWLTNSG